MAAVEVLSLRSMKKAKYNPVFFVAFVYFLCPRSDVQALDLDGTRKVYPVSGHLGAVSKIAFAPFVEILCSADLKLSC